MARQNHGPLSRAKGKLGGVVYQQYEGMQISREYQPVVKNPQTEKQVTNRAKFKLASQTVGLYKEVINVRLAKYSIYTRKRRGAAVEAIKKVVTSSDSTTAVAFFSNVVSAINSKSLTEFAAPTVTLSGSNFQVTAPGTSEVIGVIAGFDSERNFVGRKVVSGTSTGAALSFPVPAEYDMAKAMFVYSIPQTEEGRASYDNLSDPGEELHVVITRLISTGDAAVSDIAEGAYES